MNKVKKKISDLKAYLGSDSHGQKLLISVSIAVNGIRKSLAEKTKQHETLMAREKDSSLKSQLRGSQKECARLTEEAHNLSDRLHGSIAKIKILEEKLSSNNETETIESPDSLNSAPGLKALTKSVRKHTAKCPRPAICARTDLARFDQKLLCYNLDQFGSGMTGSRFMYIGEFVSLMAMFNIPCVIFSDVTVRTMFEETPEDVAVPFCKWFAKLNVHRHGSYDKDGIYRIDRGVIPTNFTDKILQVRI